MASSDHQWMAEALRQAARGLYTTHPNPRVGCVVVHDGNMVSAGWHEYTGGPHAEISALNAATVPEGADFYVTLEPCSHHGRTPPCVDAVIAARPARVVVALQDPNPEVGGRGLARLRAAGIDVVTGMLEDQARRLNRGFVKRMQRGMPHVSVKMAVSLDGRTALASGDSRWISGEASRRDVQFQRARASAILSSAQTVLDDDPRLDVRLSREQLGQQRAVSQPVRVIVDSRLRLRGDEALFACGGDVWIYTLDDGTRHAAALCDAGATVIAAEGNDSDQIDLESMLRDLARREINEVHSECGPALAGALIRQELADRILLYQAPHLLGNQARGAFDLGKIETMAERKSCKLEDLRQFGDDLRLTLNLE